MKVVIPEGFHAQACRTRHCLVHGYKTCSDKTMKISMMLHRACRQRGVPDNLAQQRPLRTGQFTQLIDVHGLIAMGRGVLL